MTPDRFSTDTHKTQAGAALAPNDPTVPPAPENPRVLRRKASFAAQAPILGAEAAGNASRAARMGVREG